jgi:hypothetical protein
VPPAQLPHAAARADELVRALNEVVAAIDRARSVGLPVDVPDQLYRACVEVIARHQSPGLPDGSGSGSSSRRASGAAADHASVHDVPLRRLVWQVINPGEEFTVNQVLHRLVLMGVRPPANAVSNALGYWVSRQRLQRLRKGVYLYPFDPALIASYEAAGQEVSAGSRIVAKREEPADSRVHEKEAKAM